LMLSSVGLGNEAERGAELGIRACLTKPVRQSVLRDAILAALATTVPPGNTPPVDVREPAGRPRRSAMCRTLVAEDNPVNSRIATAILEKHGHTITCVPNGKAAVEAVATGAFDLVLMDVQMPEMDGKAAARAIRAGERGTERHIPIIAVTAHAMKGDRESCLEAGMDAYLSKPLRANELLGAIRLMVGAEPSSPTEAGSGGKPKPPAFDVEDALARMEGDKDLLAELIDICLTEAPRMMDDIRRAIDADDPIRLERAAHAFKGSLASLGARTVANDASGLEAMGRTGDITGARARFGDMEHDYRDLENAFRAFKTEVPA
jgi:two-component system, sensor histidine kinase and response regulator